MIQSLIFNDESSACTFSSAKTQKRRNGKMATNEHAAQRALNENEASVRNMYIRELVALEGQHSSLATQRDSLVLVQASLDESHAAALRALHDEDLHAAQRAPNENEASVRNMQHILAALEDQQSVLATQRDSLALAQASLNERQAALLAFHTEELAALDGLQQPTNAVLNVSFPTESRLLPTSSMTSTLTGDSRSR